MRYLYYVLLCHFERGSKHHCLHIIYTQQTIAIRRRHLWKLWRMARRNFSMSIFAHFFVPGFECAYFGFGFPADHEDVPIVNGHNMRYACIYWEKYCSHSPVQSKVARLHIRRHANMIRIVSNQTADQDFVHFVMRNRSVMTRLKLFESIQNLLWSVSFMLTYWWFDDRAGGVAVAAAELALLASHSVGAVAVAAYSWPYSSVVRHWHWYAVVAAVPCDGCDGAAVASHADAAIFCASSSNMLSNVVFVTIVTYILQSEEATNKLFTIILIIE